MVTDETSRNLLLCTRTENELEHLCTVPQRYSSMELVTIFHSTSAGNFDQGSDAHHKTDQGEASLDGSDVGKADFCRGREFNASNDVWARAGILEEAG